MTRNWQNSLKIWAQSLQETLLPFKIGPALLWALSITLLLATLISIAFELRLTSAPKGVIYATDNDAGRAIQTAGLTRWYKSNHFAPYGNLYFRLAHTIASFSPDVNEAERTPEERSDVKHHFALVLTSLFALTSFCIFLAFLLTGSWPWSLILGNVLLHLGLHDTTWVYFLFRAHPDHLLMLAVGFSMYFTLRYTKTQSHRDFVIAGLLWGIATAVKTATILFIPSFLYLFLSEGLNKESARKGLRFVGFMLLAYLIVGFPQNFGFYKHIKFLLSESQNSRSANWDSIQLYAQLIFDQSKYLLLAFIPMHLFFGKQEKLLNQKFLIFVGIALLVLFSRRMVVPQTHHPMPFVAMLFITGIFALKLIPPLHLKYQSVAKIILVLSALYLLRDLPSAMAEQKAYQLSCRPETETLLMMVKDFQKDGISRLVREPYFPFDSSRNLDRQYWGTSMEDLDREEASLFGTKRSFGEQFVLEGPQYNMNEKANNWSDKQILYKMVLSEDSFVTPKGARFEKIHEDKCGFMLWKKVQ